MQKGGDMISHNEIRSALAEELRQEYKKLKLRSSQKQLLIRELENQQVKFTEKAIIFIDKDVKGKVCFLERGNSKAGYKHILTHAEEFKKAGISIYNLPHVLFSAIKSAAPVAIQNQQHAKGGRPIYEVTDKIGKSHLLAISVGANGFVVGANPQNKR